MQLPALGRIFPGNSFAVSLKQISRVVRILMSGLANRMEDLSAIVHFDSEACPGGSDRQIDILPEHFQAFIETTKRFKGLAVNPESRSRNIPQRTSQKVFARLAVAQLSPVGLKRSAERVHTTWFSGKYQRGDEARGVCRGLLPF